MASIHNYSSPALTDTLNAVRDIVPPKYLMGLGALGITLAISGCMTAADPSGIIADPNSIMPDPNSTVAYLKLYGSQIIP
jgi:hypothetical protein